MTTIRNVQTNDTLDGLGNRRRHQDSMLTAVPSGHVLNPGAIYDGFRVIVTQKLEQLRPYSTPFDIDHILDAEGPFPPGQSPLKDFGAVVADAFGTAKTCLDAVASVETTGGEGFDPSLVSRVSARAAGAIADFTKSVDDWIATKRKTTGDSGAKVHVTATGRRLYFGSGGGPAPAPNNTGDFLVAHGAATREKTLSVNKTNREFWNEQARQHEEMFNRRR